MNDSPSLKITEIFVSIQGEAQTIGKPTVFVRLTGCPLRCGYCDSEYAFYGGERMSIEAIVGVLHHLNDETRAEELLASLQAQGEGLGWSIPAWFTPSMIEGAKSRLRALKGEWRATPFGGRMTVTWEQN